MNTYRGMDLVEEIVKELYPNFLSLSMDRFEILLFNYFQHQPFIETNHTIYILS